MSSKERGEDMLDIATVILLFFIIFGFINLFFLNKDSKLIQIIYLISIIVLIFFAGLRGDTADTSGYREMFMRCPDFFTMLITGDFSFLFETREEPGYLLINSIVRIFTDVPELFFLSIAMLALSHYYHSIKDYAVIPMLSLLLYYTNVFMVKEMAQIRQGVAMAIFIYSLRYVVNNEFKKFLLSVIFASFFHLSILVTLIIYPLRKLKMNYSAGVGVIIVIIIFMLLDVINNFLFVFFRDGPAMQRILVYLNSVYLQNDSLTRFYEYFIVFLFFISLNTVFRSRMKNFDIMMVVFSVGLIFMAMWHEYPFIGDRFAVPMWVSLIFLLPSICLLSSNIVYRLCSYMVIVVIAVKIFTSNLGLLVNY